MTCIGFAYRIECFTSLAYLYIRKWTAYHRLTSPVTDAVYPVLKANLRCTLRRTTNMSLRVQKPSLATDLSLRLVHRLGIIYRTLLRHQHLSSILNRGWRHTYLRNRTVNDYCLCYSDLVFDIVHVYGTLNIVQIWIIISWSTSLATENGGVVYFV